jgi:prepilin peptidase CpaA
MDMSTIILTLCVAAFTAVAAYIDWRWRKLPNWLTVSCFAAALVFHFTVGLFGWGGKPAGIFAALEGLQWALLGFATGFSILCVLWLIGGGKGGDVKLMGALGAWLMPQATLYVFFITCIFVLALVLSLIVRSALTGRWRRMRKDLAIGKAARNKNDDAKNPWQRRVPYGVPVAMATWLVLAFQAYQHIYPR